jgi:hypothetical protein
MIKHQRKLDRIIFLLGSLFFLISLQLLISNKIIEYIIFLVRGLLFYKLMFYVLNLKRQFVWFYFSLFIYYLFYGLVNFNFFSFIIIDILSAFSILFLFLINNQNKDYVTKRILNIISIILGFPFIFSLIYLSVYGFRPAEVIGERIVFEEDGSNFKLLYQSIGLSIVLLPFVWFVDFKRKLAIGFSFILFTVINLISLSRGYLAGSVISILITIYIGFKSNKIGLKYSVISYSSIILFSLLFFVKQNKEVLETTLELLNYRIDLVGEEVEPRDIEAEFYFKDLSIYELFLGKGMGAANTKPFGKVSKRGIMMMHRGENNLILKGGLLLLFIIYGLAIFSLFKLLRSKDLYSNSWASVILIYLLLERGHNQYGIVLMLILLCIAISYSFSLKK